MIGKIRQFYPQTLSISFIILMSAICGCVGTAGPAATGGSEPSERVPAPPPPKLEEKKTEPEARAAEQPYDLESEMPQDDSVAEKESKIEKIEPVRPDSFSVEESLEPAASAVEYELGYRVQLAAFNDSAGARDMKKIVMAATGMAVYIDYEDGLYKVRAGDFGTRAEASEARARLAADYPDCWIVRTTVQKTK